MRGAGARVVREKAKSVDIPIHTTSGGTASATADFIVTSNSARRELRMRECVQQDAGANHE
jgi:hypothetical protein